MRLYTFGNYYLSSVQQGIQSAHGVSQLFVKYQNNCISVIDDYQPSIEEYRYMDIVDNLYDWAENHKTMICLNGGNLQGLKDIESLFQSEQNIFPWATFYEDEMSLGGILTNVCIVLPEDIYEIASKIRSSEYTISVTKVWDKDDKFVQELTDFELKLIQVLNSCQLAK